MRKFVKSVCSLMIFSVLAVSGITGYYIYNLPNSFYITKGDTLKINGKFDIEACDNRIVMQSSASQDDVMQSTVTLKLFGAIPIKDVTVKAIEEPTLVAGGNPFGIKMVTEGVMVINTTKVDTVKGEFSPAEIGGIKKGDVILEINGDKVLSNEDLQELIMRSQGDEVIVSVKRNDKVEKVVLYPEYSLSEACYKAGMWVRDSSAGIGTITFYDPQTEMFGGLGHAVCDSDTGEILPLHSGEVVAVTINGLKKGQEGNPGELVGSFLSSMSIGNLNINNQSGVFGKLDRKSVV